MKPILVPVLLLTMLPAWAQSSSSPPGAPARKSGKQDVLKSEQYSEQVATVLLSRIADGFIRRNPKLLLSAFDPQHFEGYALFADRMQARLAQHDAFRAYFRILDSAPQDSRATVNVEWQIEQSYADLGRPPTRNTGQARFTVERGAAGWKIVDVSPRDLLTGTRGPA
jgi:hypothetical protein